MNQEKFGNLIREIRKKNNLTQKDLAEKYNVTYQAVSKWENGLNMPDMSLIKQISIDFNISLEELLYGEYKQKRKKRIYIIPLFIITFLIILTVFLIKKISNNDFEFKTLSSSCSNFTISGNISYNDKKSAIYITNIKYCGGIDNEEYKKIECILYEKNNDTQKKLSSYTYSESKPIKLEDYLKDVTLTVENYESICKFYEEDNLYLEVMGTNISGRVITYKIPLKLSSCSK